MVGKVCPKCGTAAGDDDVICASCDYVLDTSFLDDGSGLVNLAADLAFDEDDVPAAPRVDPLAVAGADEIDAALGLLGDDDLNDATGSAAVSPAVTPLVSQVEFADDDESGGEEEVSFLDEGEEEFIPGADPTPDPAPPGSSLDEAQAAELAAALEDGSGIVDVPDDLATAAGGGMFDDDDVPAPPPLPPPPAPPALDLLEDDVPRPPPLDDDRSPFGGEALILGDVSGLASGKPVDFESMLSDQTGAFSIPGAPQRVFEPAPVYIAANVQEMMQPAAVVAVKEGADLAAVMLSPFERHVITLIDGARPVARIATKSGLVLSDLKIAIGLLADRGLIVLKGKYKPDVGSLLDDDDLDESGEVELSADMLAPGRSPASRNVSPFGDDLSFEAPPNTNSGQPTPFGEPMALPLDALEPLPLPLDALTPLPPQPVIPANQVVVRVTSQVDSMPVEEETAFPGMAVRPSMNTLPATAATALKPAASALAPGAKPASTPPSPAPAPAPAPPPVAAPPPVKAPPPKPAIEVSPDAKAKAQQVLELALKDLREGKKARALAYVKMASELDPTDAKIQGLLKNWGRAEGVAKSEAEEQRLVAEAQRCEDAGKYEDAATLYKKAITLKPNEPELYNRLGIILALRLKDYTGATNVLMKATELAPTNLAYRSNLGKVFKIAEGKAPKDLEMQTGDESASIKAAPGPAKGGLFGLLKKK